METNNCFIPFITFDSFEDPADSFARIPAIQLQSNKIAISGYSTGLSD